MNFYRLTECLERLQLRHAVLATAQGGKLVVLERGARLLGVFPQAEADNLLWISPGLSEPEAARRQFAAGTDWNIGGDRTWLSPEIEYNIGNADDVWNTYAVQSRLDPGSYRLETFDDRSAALRQRTAPTAHRSQRTSPLEMRKTFRTIPDPLAQARIGLAERSYAYAGWATAASVRRLGRGAAPLALWHLAQLPAGGRLIVPTYGTAEVSRFFGVADATRLSVRPHAVSVELDARQAFKLSIKAPFVTGRMGYWREPDADCATLIVRQFAVRPSATYGDVFAPDLDDAGHCVQIYNEDGKLGQFGEMEFHTPQLGEGSRRLEDGHETWCYSGDKPAIAAIARLWLGCDPTDPAPDPAGSGRTVPGR